MEVITRFAPSPSGDLHIGSLRTALFNYLFTKSNGGKFLLRVEDTDQNRISSASLNKVIDGLKWMGLDWDGEIVYQSKRKERHLEIVSQLIKSGHAYYCYISEDEISHQRELAKNNKKQFVFRSPYRDDKSLKPTQENYVIRLKIQEKSQTILNDLVAGDINILNNTIEDTVLVRSNGLPTYLLAVVVDDHDMNITHILRGDDHITNSFRQINLFKACDFKVPLMGHIPLIHSIDGTKLSKRHHATGIIEYKKMGYFKEAIEEYLLMLGYSNSNEVSDISEIKRNFKVSNIRKSPSRFDIQKLNSINSNYLKNMNNEEIYDYIKEDFSYLFNTEDKKNKANSNNKIIKEKILEVIELLKNRSNSYLDIVDMSRIFFKDYKQNYNEDLKMLIDKYDSEIINSLCKLLSNMDYKEESYIKNQIEEFSIKNKLALGKIMKLARIIITGKLGGPGIFKLIEIIGKEEIINRIGRFNEFIR